MEKQLTPNQQVTPVDLKIAMKRTAQEVFVGYANWDLNALIAPRTADCTHQLLPKSMNFPEMNNEQYRDYIIRFTPFLRNFTSMINRAVFDTDTRTAASHVSATAESPTGGYRNEYWFYVTFTEDGSKIWMIEEFVDSAATVQQLIDLRKAPAKHGGAEGERRASEKTSKVLKKIKWTQSIHRCDLSAAGPIAADLAFPRRWWSSSLGRPANAMLRRIQ